MKTNYFISRRQFLKGMSASAALVGMTGILSACGGGSKPATSSGAAAADASAAAPAASGDGISVVIADNDQFTTCDDFNNFALTNKLLERLWADPLIELNYDTGEYTGVIAESWVWAEDGLSVDVKLRQGVLFSNGAEVTAEDVKFTYERIITDENLTNVARWSKFTSGEVKGDYEVVLNFAEKMPNFETESVFVPIICKAAYEEDAANYFNAPIGTGPYTWYSTDFVNNTGTLQRRDEWWGYDFYGTTPSNVDFITYSKVDEDTTRVSSLRTGEVTIARALPLDQVSTIEGDGLTAITTDLSRNTFFSMNCAEGHILSDKRIREAISLSIDRQLLVDSIVGGGTPSVYCFPSNCTGYNPDAVGFEYDIEKAKSLLSEAGYNGEEIPVQVASGIVTRGVEVAQAIQAMCSESGLNLTIQQMETAAYNEARFGGDYEISLCNFINTEGDTLIVGQELLGRTDVFCTGFVDDDVFALVDEFSVTMDAAAREALQMQAYDKVVTNFAPFVYLYDESYAVGANASLSGLELKYDMLMELRYMQMA